MANYIDRKANSGNAESVDIRNIMPYLGEELRNIRQKDKEKQLAFSKTKQMLMENPEGFAGAKYDIENDGNLLMNDKAKEYARVDRNENYSQTAIDNTNEEFDINATKQLGDMVLEDLNADGTRKVVGDKAKEVAGAVDTSELFRRASNQESLDGKNLNTGNSSPLITPKTANVSDQVKDAIDNVVGTDNSTGLANGTPVVVDKQEASVTNTPEQKSPLATQADITKNTGVGTNVSANAKDKNNAGAGGGKNYSIDMNIGVGKSSADVELAKRITTQKRLGINDVDNSNLAQLRKASALEGVMDALSGGTPASPMINRMQNRLAQREAFLLSIGDTYGKTVNSSTLVNGKAKYELGEINAGVKATAGANSYTYNSTQVDAKTNVKTNLPGPDKDPNANKVQSETFVVDGITYESQKLDRQGNKNVNNSGQTGILPISYDNIDWNTKKKMEKQLKGKGEEYIYFPESVGHGIKIRYIDGKPKNSLIDPGGYYNANLEQSYFKTGKALNAKSKASNQDVKDPTLTDYKGTWNPKTNRWE